MFLVAINPNAMSLVDTLKIFLIFGLLQCLGSYLELRGRMPFKSYTIEKLRRLEKSFGMPADQIYVFQAKAMWWVGLTIGSLSLIGLVAVHVMSR